MSAASGDPRPCIDRRDPARQISAPRIARIASITYLLSVFFASRPDEELTEDDIAIKFGVRREEVYERVRRALEAGIVERVNARGRGDRIPRGNFLGARQQPPTAAVVYRPGPALLRVIGSFSQREEAAQALGIAMDTAAEDETRL